MESDSIELLKPAVCVSVRSFVLWADCLIGEGAPNDMKPRSLFILAVGFPHGKFLRAEAVSRNSLRPAAPLPLLKNPFSLVREPKADRERARVPS